MTETLEERFHRRLESSYWEVGRATSYWASRFLQKVRRVGGLQAAREWLDPKKTPPRDSTEWSQLAAPISRWRQWFSRRNGRNCSLQRNAALLASAWMEQSQGAATMLSPSTSKALDSKDRANQSDSLHCIGVRQWSLTQIGNQLSYMEMQQSRPERVYNAPGAAIDGLSRYPVVACRILGGGGALQQFKRSRSALVSAFV